LKGDVLKLLGSLTSIQDLSSKELQRVEVDIMESLDAGP